MLEILSFLLTSQIDRTPCICRADNWTDGLVGIGSFHSFLNFFSFFFRFNALIHLKRMRNACSIKLLAFNIITCGLFFHMSSIYAGWPVFSHQNWFLTLFRKVKKENAFYNIREYRTFFLNALKIKETRWKKNLTQMYIVEELKLNSKKTKKILLQGSANIFINNHILRRHLISHVFDKMPPFFFFSCDLVQFCCCFCSAVFRSHFFYFIFHIFLFIFL